MNSEKPYQWLSWLGTITVLISASMASLNLYPYYAYSYVISNMLWMYIGYVWREKSLIALGAGVNIIFIAGLLFK